VISFRNGDDDQELRAMMRKMRRYRAPDVLRARIRLAIRGSVAEHATDVREPAMWTSRHRVRRFGVAAGFLFAAVFGSVLATIASQAGDPFAREIAVDHLRALDPGRATDIESPNHVEVRAWFAARIRPVPAVTRLDDLGYRLVGGRLDVLAGRRVAAVVYRRREHAISVYSWVASSRDSTEATADGVRGVQLLHWQRGTVVTCVASDLSVEEVRQFAASLRLAEGVE
jgi:anti-sigma factor RsiW